MDVSEPLHLELELGRVDKTSDPFGFQFTPQDYFWRHDRGSYETLHLQWSTDLLADLSAVRMPDRDPAITQRLGETLRSFLAGSAFSTVESQILNAIAAQRSITLTLRFAAAELYALPWELLTISTTGQHLGELPALLLRYEWPEIVATSVEKPAQQEQGRILFAWSAAAGGVPAAEQLTAIESACRDGFLSFDRQRDVIEHASCKRILDALKAAQSDTPISILHLLCHGAAAGQTFGLALNDDVDSSLTIVDAGRLRQLLAPFAGMVRLVILSTCDAGNSGTLGNQLGSIAQTLHRVGFAQVVASRQPLSTSGSIHFTETFYRALIVPPSSVEQALLEARRQLAIDASSSDWAALQLYAHAAEGMNSRPIIFRPYRGLLAFQPEHQRFFIGRDREIAELCSDLRSLREQKQPRLIAVDGASGTGKSSVVFAGAVPQLLTMLGPSSELVRMRPGSAPEQVLDQALAARSNSGPTLLVIDQFEELFTQVEDPRVRQSFARKVFALACAPDLAVDVIITLRSDFVGRCGELLLDDNGLRLDRLIYDDSHRVSIAQMNTQQLREVIEGPAARVGLQLEHGLVQRMLHDVDSEPGALPLLADTLDLLWQRREKQLLTQQSYDEIGGVTGALHGRANALIDALSAAEKLQARRLFVRLGSGFSEGTQVVRLRVQVAARRPQDPRLAADFDAVLRRLVDARLLVLDDDREQQTVEVAHEALLRKWPRLFEWAREDRQLLIELDTVENWVREASRSKTVLSADRLAYMEAVEARDRDALSDEARVLLQASQSARRASEEQQRVARDSLRMLAVQALAHDPTRQAVVLREVESSDPTVVPGWLGTVRSLLQTHAFTIAELVGPGGLVESVQYNSTETHVLTVSTDRRARVWALDGEAPPVVLACAGSSIDTATFSSKGDRILTLCHDGVVRIWDRDGHGEPIVIRAAHDISNAAWGPDDRQILTRSGSQIVAIIDLDGKELFRVSAPRQRSYLDVAWSPNGQHLATASSDGKVQIHPIGTKGKPIVFNSNVQVLRLQWSASSRHLLASADDGSVRILDTAGNSRAMPWNGDRAFASIATLSPDGTKIALVVPDLGVCLYERDSDVPETVLSASDFIPSLLKWSADGSRLAAASGNSVLVWNLKSSRLPLTLTGHGGEVRSLDFSPDGHRIATAADDKVVRIWDLDRTDVERPVPLREGDSDVHFIFQSVPPITRPLSVSSADHKLQATAEEDGSIVIESLEHDADPIVLKDVGSDVGLMEFSPDGSKLFVANEDMNALIYTLPGGELVHLSGHTQSVCCARFSTDGQRIITGHADGRALVRNCDGSGTPLSFDEHKGCVVLAHIGLDGQHFATVANGERLYIWSAGGYSETITFAEWHSPLAIRADWKQVVTRQQRPDAPEGIVEERLLWDLDLQPRSLIARLCRATPLCLSVKERKRYLREPHDLAVTNYERSLALAQRIRIAGSL